MKIEVLEWPKIGNSHGLTFHERKQERIKAMKQKDWGVIQNFELVADTFTSLKAACEIALTEHTASGFAWGINKNNIPELEIHWVANERNIKFLTEIKDAETLAREIQKWLDEKGMYDNCEQWDIDGYIKEGFRIQSNKLSHYSVMFTVVPEYIIYRK